MPSLRSIFDGKDLDGDGVADYGSCFQRTGFGVELVLENCIHAVPGHVSRGSLPHGDVGTPA